MDGRGLNERDIRAAGAREAIIILHTRSAYDQKQKDGFIHVLLEEL